ncbi:Inactive polypeptide N-acetylgalactosaminyltransferase-like protein 5 [Camelus dromedarius]|uniref:Inactive polypeptide N-acetylgalactosaminyltransferase-like protein 5 n=1 Tax=Camelus dromedarius TaxID=9838 RepID=A0A5N4DZE8_CAMDR|nr:Inactive polypeptide N-acetylgalactosaminyltransferase-like protein 5 [Camelus dromedarius]
MSASTQQACLLYLPCVLDKNVNPDKDLFFQSDINPRISPGLLDQSFSSLTSACRCHRKQYPVTLPTASIIICFHNEEFNALMRTVSSVMSLTPHHILEEIILVDDMSEYGDVLVFLDSHCEVNKAWLEPLLHAIDKDPKVVVCPLIDVIDDMTLEYKPSPVVRGAFNWHLQFKWDLIFSYELNGPEGPTRPIRSPAMAGGIFAINRHYFYELGQYDKGMNLWGGENMEISLRIWMCGGQLLIIPCSRVGHVVKQHITNQTEVAKALAFNNLRVVHVWLDDYKVKDVSLVWKDEWEYREELAQKKPCTAFPDTSFYPFLSCP